MKKFFSCLLAVTIMLSSIPFAANADELSSVPESGGVTEDTSVSESGNESEAEPPSSSSDMEADDTSSSEESSEVMEGTDNSGAQLESQPSDVKTNEGVNSINNEIEFGNVEVRVFSRDSQKNMDSVTAELVIDGNSLTGKTSKPQDDITLFTFESIPNGTYKLFIKGDNYETYEQEVTVNNNVNKIRVINTHRYNQSYIETDENMGSFGYGDFNSDSIIDELDKNELIDALETGSK